MHEFFHYVGNDIHFKNANIMILIIVMFGVIIGMLLTRVIQIIATKTPSHDKYSGSLDDLVDSVNGVRRWRPKS